MTATHEAHPRAGAAGPDDAGAGARPDDGTAAALAAQRDFLLRSLVDLDAEHAAGELSDSRYRELHDRYTVEAATVLRALERLSTVEPEAARPKRRPRGLAVAAAAVIALIATGATLLVRSTATRQPGQSITGNAQSGADLDSLARAARSRPADPDAQLAYASALLDAGKLVDALKAFDTAARLDPADPVAKAYGGWIVSLAGLTDEALSRLDAAVAADPAYPDAHFFRGMVLLRGRGDRAAGEAELREYLRLAPPGPERDEVQDLLAGLPPTTTTTTGAP
ncbi:MAG: tetratricopeptide repeat protein [Acidimicrobiia bacterium]